MSQTEKDRRTDGRGFQIRHFKALVLLQYSAAHVDP
jgi:hypothetical protein